MGSVKRKDIEGSDCNSSSGDNNDSHDYTSSGDEYKKPFPKSKFHEDDLNNDLPSLDSNKPGSASDTWNKKWKEKGMDEKNKRREKASDDDSLLTDWNTYVF